MTNFDGCKDALVEMLAIPTGMIFFVNETDKYLVLTPFTESEFFATAEIIAYGSMVFLIQNVENQMTKMDSRDYL